MCLKEKLGKNIQKYRKLRNITQEKLAELIGVEINSISAIERGRSFPSPENLTKIIDALNVPLADLCTFNQEYSCEDYKKEILTNIELIEYDKTKLRAINAFIKTLL